MRWLKLLLVISCTLDFPKQNLCSYWANIVSNITRGGQK